MGLEKFFQLANNKPDCIFCHLKIPQNNQKHCKYPNQKHCKYPNQKHCKYPNIYVFDCSFQFSKIVPAR